MAKEKKESIIKRVIKSIFGLEFYSVVQANPNCFVWDEIGDFVINNFTGNYNNVARNKYRSKNGFKMPGYSPCKRCHNRIIKNNEKN